MCLFDSWKNETCSALSRNSWSSIGLWSSVHEFFLTWNTNDIVWFEATRNRCDCWWKLTKNIFWTKAFEPEIWMWFQVFVEMRNTKLFIALPLAFATTIIDLKWNFIVENWQLILFLRLTFPKFYFVPLSILSRRLRAARTVISTYNPKCMFH